VRDAARATGNARVTGRIIRPDCSDQMTLLVLWRDIFFPKPAPVFAMKQKLHPVRDLACGALSPAFAHEAAPSGMQMPGSDSESVI
jgi:hypothetical protein